MQLLLEQFERPSAVPGTVWAQYKFLTATGWTPDSIGTFSPFPNVEHLRRLVLNFEEELPATSGVASSHTASTESASEDPELVGKKCVGRKSAEGRNALMLELDLRSGETSSTCAFGDPLTGCVLNLS